MVPTIEAGSSVNIRAHVYRIDVNPRVLADPGSGVTLRIIFPGGTVSIPDLSMTRLTTGIYQYEYQTIESQTTGLYTLQATTSDDTTWVSVELAGFKLIEPT